MQVEQARRLKDLEKENGRLKKLVADLSLDISILKRLPGETSKPVQGAKADSTYNSGTISLPKTGLQSTQASQSYPKKGDKCQL
jgi:hypothetical protein